VRPGDREDRERHLDAEAARRRAQGAEAGADAPAGGLEGAPGEECEAACEASEEEQHGSGSSFLDRDGRSGGGAAGGGSARAVRRAQYAPAGRRACGAAAGPD
jgi:hypothetical protein